MKPGAPSIKDSDPLIDEVRHRRRHDPRPGIELPELPAVGCAVCGEDPVGTSLKYEVARRREEPAPVERQHREAPGPAMRHRVPGEQLTRRARELLDLAEERAGRSGQPRRRCRDRGCTSGAVSSNCL